MRLRQLIERLERELREHGDVEVVITIDGEAELNHAEPLSVVTEQRHDTETMFVRITGEE